MQILLVKLGRSVLAHSRFAAMNDETWNVTKWSVRHYGPINHELSLASEASPPVYCVPGHQAYDDWWWWQFIDLKHSIMYWRWLIDWCFKARQHKMVNLFNFARGKPGLVVEDGHVIVTRWTKNIDITSYVLTLICPITTQWTTRINNQ